MIKNLYVKDQIRTYLHINPQKNQAKVILVLNQKLLLIDCIVIYPDNGKYQLQLGYIIKVVTQVDKLC